MKVKNFLIIQLIGFWLLNNLWSSEIAIPRKIVDSPTAGNLSRGTYQFDLKFLPQGGVWAEVVVGLTNNLYFGLSYGVSNLIGSDVIQTVGGPGICGQLRIIEETVLGPAIAIGYNNQDIGPYNNDTTDYYIKAKGLYLTLSKNYRFLGNLGLHAGISYRIKEKDSTPNLFFLVNKELNSELYLSAEYDAALNDQQIKWGYLNLGISWIASDKLLLEFDFKNILQNPRLIDANRELRIVYQEHF